MDAHCIFLRYTTLPYFLKGGVQFLGGASGHHFINKRNVLPGRKYYRKLIFGGAEYVIDAV